MVTAILPYRLTNQSIGSVYTAVMDEERQPRSQQVTFDFVNINFVETSGLTGLINLIEWLKIHDISVSFSNFERNTRVISYLDDTGFFQRYLNRTVTPFVSPRNTTFDLIEMSYRHTWLDNNLVRWISDKTGYFPSSFDDLKTALLEVLHNIQDHSQTNIGCVFAQYYPNPAEILISISDFGVGIPYNVNRYFGAPLTHDCLAIETACQPDFTTSSTAGNAGRGLPLLIDIIAKKYNGYVEIISNRGYIRYTGTTLTKNLREEEHIHPGCNIQLRFRERNVENIEDNREEFEWV